MDEPIEDLYFNWLYSKVAWHDLHTPSTSYQSLLYALHTTEFVWLVTGDSNRAEDGRVLREEFLRELRCEVDDNWMDLNCSVLEMLIAFSRRCSIQTESMSSNAWFWLFLENLTLSDISDGVYRSEGHRIGPAVEAFVWRYYDQFGRNGGLFPLRYSQNDQTKVELWYQFSEYLVDTGIS